MAQSSALGQFCAGLGPNQFPQGAYEHGHDHGVFSCADSADQFGLGLCTSPEYAQAFFFKIAYYYFLAAMFIPFPIVMLPVVKEAGLLGLDNQAGLIVLYTLYGFSMNIFLYTTYLHSIPMELEEAARVDGASTWRVFWQIIFPLLMPMNATVGILTCVWAWNDFIMPLVVLTDPGARTLPLAQYVFQGQYNTNYTVAFASYLMAMAPLLIVYIFSQRWVISGVVRGSVK